MTKKILLAVCLCVSWSAFSQITYLSDTAFTTDAGYDGGPASCAFTGGTVDGWQMNRLISTWLADSFTVPAGSTWIFDTVILYGQQRFSGTASTFNTCNLQIYAGQPGYGGTVVWGDSVTNCLASTGFTGIYRVDTTVAYGALNDTVRPIMYLKLYLEPAPVLVAGTYWLAWSAAGTLSNTSTTGCPPKVLPGRINPPNQMGMQYYHGAWDYTSDHGQNEGFSKIIKARAGVEAVSQILVHNTLAQNMPNPFTTSTDIMFYMRRAGYARLEVFDVFGRLVATLADGMVGAGAHHATLHANNLPSGNYYYRLSTADGSECRPMTVR